MPFDASNPITGSDCKLIPIGEDRIMKSGSRIALGEAKAMQHAYDLKLPVPKVHEIHQPCPRGFIGIEMERMHGEVLEGVWPSLSTEQKRGVARQLRGIIDIMRATPPSAEQLIGACGGGPAIDRRMYSSRTGGPFRDEQEFNEFTLELYKLTPEVIRDALATALRQDHRLAFTHGDLSPRNILVTDGQITALLDWEFSGWYPEHHEYVKFFEAATKCRDWIDFSNDIFSDTFPAELVMQQAVMRWQNP